MSVITRIEGALYESDIPEDMSFVESRRITRAYPFQLGIMRNGEIANPDEIEAGHPTWFSAPRFAKDAGVALAARYPETLGYDIVKVVDGHWRTVCTEWKS